MPTDWCRCLQIVRSLNAPMQCHMLLQLLMYVLSPHTLLLHNTSGIFLFACTHHGTTHVSPVTLYNPFTGSTHWGILGNCLHAQTVHPLLVLQSEWMAWYTRSTVIQMNTDDIWPNSPLCHDVLLHHLQFFLLILYARYYDYSPLIFKSHATLVYSIHTCT